MLVYGLVMKLFFPTAFYTHLAEYYRYFTPRLDFDCLPTDNSICIHYRSKMNYYFPNSNATEVRLVETTPSSDWRLPSSLVLAADALLKQLAERPQHCVVLHPTTHLRPRVLLFGLPQS